MAGKLWLFYSPIKYEGRVLYYYYKDQQCFWVKTTDLFKRKFKIFEELYHGLYTDTLPVDLIFLLETHPPYVSSDFPVWKNISGLFFIPYFKNTF